MTTPQPAALPELTQLTGDIQIQDRTIYVLNKNGENAWWATVYPGFHDNGIRVSDDQCRAVAADLARLAALQSQPAEAGVSDRVVKALLAQALFFKEGAHTVASLEADIRAILALRPQSESEQEKELRRSLAEAQATISERNAEIIELQKRIRRSPQEVPMTDEQMTPMDRFLADSAKETEKHLLDLYSKGHGITAQGAQGGEG